MARAGLVRAEGQSVTSASSTDKILIQKYSSVSGQYEPREITVSNLLTGGGTGFTQNSIPFANASGDLDEDNTNLNFVDSTNTLTATNATGSTLSYNKLSTGATPVPYVDIAGTTLTPAAGSTNVCNVTIQLKDGSGTNIARIVPLVVYLSDSSTGAGVTATTASGTVQAGATGTDLVALTAKKVIKAITDASGSYTLAITDSAKTGFYVVASAEGFGLKVSSQLVTGNYG